MGDHTIETLKELVESQLCAIRDTIRESDRRYQQQFEASEKATKVAMDAAEKAVTKAETATEKRFDSVNEFRATLADQAATLVGRAEYGAAHAALVEKIDALNLRVTEHLGSAAGGQVTKVNLYAAVAGCAALVGVVAGVFAVVAR